MPTRSFSVTRTGAGVGIAASEMADARTTAKDLTTKRKATNTVEQHYRGSAYAQRRKSHFEARHVDESQSGVKNTTNLSKYVARGPRHPGPRVTKRPIIRGLDP